MHTVTVPLLKAGFSMMNQGFHWRVRNSVTTKRNILNRDDVCPTKTKTLGNVLVNKLRPPEHARNLDVNVTSSQFSDSLKAALCTSQASDVT